MKNNYLIIMMLSLLSWGILPAQIGTQFWFVAPDVTSGYSDNPVYLRISSYTSAATVTISQPANNSFVPQVVNLGANSTQSINLTSVLSDLENSPVNLVRNKGLYINSTAEISVCYEVQAGGNNPDIFILKSYNALGNRFVIPAQRNWHNVSTYSPGAYSSFEIVATEDGTKVTIIPKKNIIGHSAGIPFTVNLNEGQTYSAKASSNLSFNHLGGSEVRSNKPIAVTIMDDAGYNSAYGTCRDLMGDQIVPVERVGTEYIVSKGHLANGSGISLNDRIYITAAHDGTTIRLNTGGAVVATINKGDQYELVLSAADVAIRTNLPVYVLHVTGVGCEVGTALISPLDCSGLEEISFVRSLGGDFHLSLLVPAGGQGTFSVNGNPSMISASSFNSVIINGSNYKVARLSFSSTDFVPGSTYTISNTNKRFHMALINGTNGSGCMYGYFTDFNIVRPETLYHY